MGPYIENGKLTEASAVYSVIVKNKAKISGHFATAVELGVGETRPYINFPQQFKMLFDQFEILVVKYNEALDKNTAFLVDRVKNAVCQFSNNQRELGLDNPNRAQSVLGLMRYGHFVVPVPPVENPVQAHTSDALVFP